MQLSRARRLEAAGQLAGQIAHDFNNLLGPVLAYPELIRMQIEPDSPVARMLGDIEDAATQMAEINQQLLTLSRRGHYNIEAVDMNALTERTLRTLEIPESITVDCRLGSDLLPARGGRAQLARVIANLIQNAHEAMGNDGTLTLKTELVYLDTDVQRYELIPAGEYVLWSVGDTGGGIDPGITNKIFDPFFTTKSSDKRRGSGLGLAVVHSVVHDHDGYIDVESTPHVGTTFRLYLPVERTLDVAADDPDEIPHGHNEHILVADDDPLQRRLAHTALERLGYTVTLATCGEEAVDLAARQSFDLLILDMIMDGIDGAETYARICRTHPQQKAIVLSGYASGDRVEDAINLGVRQFLPKPVRLPALANAIHAALHSDNGGRPASVTTSRG
jgi:CheY-like chemotaxis protein